LEASENAIMHRSRRQSKEAPEISAPRGDISSVPADVLSPDRQEEYILKLNQVIARKLARTPSGKKKPGPKSNKQLALSLFRKHYPNGIENRRVKDVHDDLIQRMDKLGAAVTEKTLTRYGIRKETD
jgi:hypothetical protein